MVHVYLQSCPLLLKVFLGSRHVVPLLGVVGLEFVFGVVGLEFVVPLLVVVQSVMGAPPKLRLPCQLIVA